MYVCMYVWHVCMYGMYVCMYELYYALQNVMVETACDNMFALSAHLCTTTGFFLGIWAHLWTTRMPIPLAAAGYRTKST